jgi:hypothetical protein
MKSLTNLQDNVRIFFELTMENMKRFRKIGLIILFSFVLVTPGSYAQETEPQVNVPDIVDNSWRGKFEIELHYGTWTLDFAKGLFENELKKRMGDEIGIEISHYLNDTHAQIQRADYAEEMVVDTWGSNYGIELRYYPQGWEGSFSLGLSIEKTKMNMSAIGIVTQHFTDGSFAEVDAEGFIYLNPLSTNLSFRWDTKPSWIVTPYIVVGLGLAVMSGNVTYNYRGVYHWLGPQEVVEDTEEKTIQEFEETIDFNLPNIFPILQMNVGVRGRILPFLHVRGEAGLWNGLLFRFGLSFRF